MQGRLSQKKDLPLQSFPIKTWEDEFKVASQIGFDNIEWLIDGISDATNPIFSADGRLMINKLCKANNLSVNSVCGLFLLSGNILSKDKDISSMELNKLNKALNASVDAGINYFIIPLMDSLTLKNEAAKLCLLDIFNNKLTAIRPMILLETDIEAIKLRSIFRSLKSDFGVLYDLGNANAFNFDICSEIKILQDLIKEIHIKDRETDGGESYSLGMGGTNFNEIFSTLRAINWTGNLVLETSIFKDWEVEAKKNYSFSSSLMKLLKQ